MARGSPVPSPASVSGEPGAPSSLSPERCFTPMVRPPSTPRGLDASINSSYEEMERRSLASHQAHCAHASPPPLSSPGYGRLTNQGPHFAPGMVTGSNMGWVDSEAVVAQYDTQAGCPPFMVPTPPS